MERNVPKLRFKGFIDEWKLSNLKKLCDINPKSKQLPDKFVYIDLESIIDGVLIKKNIIELKDAPSRAQRLLNVGDVLFQTVRPYQMNNYLFEYELNYKSVASTGYAQLRCKSCISNNKFIYQALHNKKFNNKVMLRCTGTSYPAINSSELVTIPLRIPSLQEQERIANFLTKVDKIIEKQDEKVKNLEKYKKGMMQKIFSQEIRFKDENGEAYPEWEEARLNNVLSIPEKIKTEIIEKDKLLTVKLHMQGIKVNKNVDTLNIGATVYYKRKAGQFIYGKQNFFNGAFGIVPEELDGYLSSGDIPALNINRDRIIPEYLINYIGRTEFYKKTENLSSGTGSKRIHEKTLLEIVINIPCVAEQERIANFLSNIDLVIDKENKKLEELKRWKKGLLQQMFV